MGLKRTEPRVYIEGLVVWFESIYRNFQDGWDWRMFVDELWVRVSLSPELRIPAILAELMRTRNLRMEACIFVELLGPVAVLSLAITACKYTRLVMSLLLLLTGYFYMAGFMLMLSIYSFCRAPAYKPEGAVQLLEKRRTDSITYIIMSACFVAGFSWLQVPMIYLYGACALAGVVVLFNALTTVRLHSAADVGSLLLMLACAVAVGAACYGASRVNTAAIVVAIRGGGFWTEVPEHVTRQVVHAEEMVMVADYMAKRGIDPAGFVDVGEFREPRARPQLIRPMMGLADIGAFVVPFYATVVSRVAFVVIMVHACITDSIGWNTIRAVGDMEMKLRVEEMKSFMSLGLTRAMHLSLCGKPEWICMWAVGLVQAVVCYPPWQACLCVLAEAAALLTSFGMWEQSVGLIAKMDGTNANRRAPGEVGELTTARYTFRAYSNAISITMIVATLLRIIAYASQGGGFWLCLETCVGCIQMFKLARSDWFQTGGWFNFMMGLSTHSLGLVFYALVDIKLERPSIWWSAQRP